MNLLKKCTAMLLTGAITLSCAACSGEDTAWIMRNGELEMPAGAYINSLIESYYEASSLVEDSEKDVLKQQIDGKDADEWKRPSRQPNRTWQFAQNSTNWDFPSVNRN